MFCPTCGVENPAEAAFCGSCGSRIAGAGAPTGQTPPPPWQAQPSVPISGAPSGAPYGAPPSAAPPYGTPPSAAPPYGTPPYAAPPYGPAPYGGMIPPLPPSSRPTIGNEGSRGALIVGMVAGAVAVLALIGGGIFLLLGNGDGGVDATDSSIGIPTTTIAVSSTDTAPPSTISPPTTPAQPGTVAGFPSAKAAVEAVTPAGWVLQLADETGGQVEYWSGPPQSEWVTAYLVEEASDGTWSVVDTWDLGASDVPATTEDEVRYLVDDFLFAIMSDDPDYAHSLTVEPFASDPASAQYSNGDFIDFNIVAVEAQSDGTYWVKVEEEWSWGVDRWRYHAVPTEIGWRINDLRDW